MAATLPSTLSQDTAYKREPTQSQPPPTQSTPRPSTASMTSPDPNRSNITFAKAAFAFRDSINNAPHSKAPQATTVTTKPVDEPVSHPGQDVNPDPEQLADKAHQERHKRRIRVARGVQHTLTSLLSLAVAILQGRVYINYMQTKDVPNAWPTHPNLLPTLMLFVTAIAALFIDLCAIIAYLWPQKRAGQRAYSVCASPSKTHTWSEISNEKLR